MSRVDDDRSSGHHRTAGHVIAGMGGLAVSLFLLTLVLDVDLGFIDQSGILMIACVFLVVGGLMSTTSEGR